MIRNVSLLNGQTDRLALPYKAWHNTFFNSNFDSPLTNKFTRNVLLGSVDIWHSYPPWSDTLTPRIERINLVSKEFRKLEPKSCQISRTKQERTITVPFEGPVNWKTFGVKVMSPHIAGFFVTQCHIVSQCCTCYGVSLCHCVTLCNIASQCHIVLQFSVTLCHSVPLCHSVTLCLIVSKCDKVAHCHNGYQ
jgi:hypothetical protein